jgi:hypothetical protein
MSLYTIEQDVRSDLELPRYPPTKGYWVLRDGVRLSGRHASLSEAEAAMRERQEADAKQEARHTIKERQGGSLDTGAVGFAKYRVQTKFAVYRDDVLVGPYDSRDEAERAIEKLKQADRKKENPAL